MVIESLCDGRRSFAGRRASSGDALGGNGASVGGGCGCIEETGRRVDYARQGRECGRRREISLSSVWAWEGGGRKVEADVYVFYQCNPTPSERAGAEAGHVSKSPPSFVAAQPCVAHGRTNGNARTRGREASRRADACAAEKVGYNTLE